jgi:hypothetical protein
MTTTNCGCGVVHMVAHTTPVREDLGSILTQTKTAVMENFFQTTDLRKDFIHL